MLGELVTILEQFRSKRIRGRDGVWRIDGTSKEADACKLRLLDVVCTAARPFVRYDEPPAEQAALAAAAEVQPGTWQLPAGAPGAAVLEWLHMGNWQLCVAPAPLASIPDLCRASDAAVAQFVADSRVSLVIDAFHDDVLWVIGLGGDVASGNSPASVRP